jgi:cellulose biosynthesis protein BcsQ
MFKFEWTQLRLTWLTRGLFAAAILLTFAALNFWADVEPLVKSYEPTLKLLGYMVGPILALAGFIAATKDKIELRDQALTLGQQKEVAEAATIRANAAEAAAGAQTKVVNKLKAEVVDLATGAGRIWNLRPPRPFTEYYQWSRQKSAKIVTIGNIKGGVGKTMIAANFAAYLSETLHKNVLVIDLDYQGALSSMLLEPLGRIVDGSPVNMLFAPTAGLNELLQARVHLVPEAEVVTTRLSRAWLVPAFYEFWNFDKKLAYNWLMDKDQAVDARYLLAHVLLRPEVQREYDVIIIDLPPQTGMNFINALVSSHYFFVPTPLDRLSVQVVTEYLSTVKALKDDLSLELNFGGLIGNLTNRTELTSIENSMLENLAHQGASVWPSNKDVMLRPTIPRRVAISNAVGAEIPYLLSNSTARLGVREVLDPLFAEMTSRIKLG